MLIAEIYPIQRLPRRFSVFDYLVPEGLKLKRGDFVSIPWRQQKILGVVKKIHERFSPRPGLKKIFRQETFLSLQEKELELFEWLAKDLAQSVPAVLKAAIPQSTKPKENSLPIINSLPLKIRSNETVFLRRSLQTIEERRRAFITSQNLPRMAATVLAYLHLHPNDRVAIITPGVNEVEELIPYFNHLELTFVTGKNSEAQRLKVWDDFRRHKTKILLGTHLAALLLPADLDAIFVFRSSSENHKQWDRNPRYDAREIVKKIQSLTGCRLYFFDTTPRTDDLLSFEPEQIIIDHPEPRPYFIDLNNERPFSPHPIISQTLYETVEKILKNNRRVLCFYNRTGKAASLRCSDCGQGFPCPICGGIFSVHETSIQCHHCGRTEPTPITCPNCRGPNLIERGFGNQTIKQVLQKIFPLNQVAIIDKTLQEDGPDKDIVLTTSYYLETYKKSFVTNNFGLVVNLDADLPLLLPGFHSLEKAVHQLEDLRGLATHEQALFLVQTRSRELLEKYYNDPKNYLQNESELCRAYKLPPFVRYMKLKIRDQEERRAELELEVIINNLKTMEGVNFFPIKCEKKIGCSVSLAVEPKVISALLDKLFELPDRVVIDTNLIS